MPVLTLKMIRDLWRAKWQYVAVGAMVMLGVMFFNASYAAYRNLKESYDNSYKLFKFEDFGITFNLAPERAADRVRQIPGVVAAEGRLVEDVEVELPGRAAKKLVGRLISIPTEGFPKVDGFKLIKGRAIRGRTSHEVLLEASFAKYQKLEPGDTIDAVRGASRARFRIAGIVQSIEYLYVVRSKQELIPFPDTFGVMFVSGDVLGPLVGKQGQINEVRALVEDPAQLDRIMRQAKAALAAYRPDDAIPREDQPSSQLLKQDVEGFRMYAILFPAFFLSVAGLTVYTLLLRMVHQQRPVIGLMRSLGYSTPTVVLHYMGAALMVGVVFSLLGTVLGLLMASWISTFYMSHLQVPFEQIIPRWGVMGVGLAIGTGVCVVAGYFPSRVAASIRPAEAMRPVTPSFGSRWLLIDRLMRGVKLLYRIPLRNVTRQPRRTISTLFGIISGLALMITAKGLLDSSQAAISDMIERGYAFDLRVDFMKQRSHVDVSRVSSWPGVQRAEGTLTIPVDMQHAGRTYSASLMGVEPGAQLMSLKGEDGRAIRVREGGAIFGLTLKKRLGLEIGDTVSIAIPDEFSKETPSPRFIQVLGFNEEAMATQAYCTLSQAQMLFRKDLELPPNAIGTIFVKCDPIYLRQTRERLLELTGAGSVISVPEMKKMVQEMLKTIETFIWIMEMFGAALAFAMVFNMVTVNVLERESEVATLRTIGVSRWEISRTIVIENMVVTAIGIVVGLPVAKLFVQWFWQAAQTEEQQELFTYKIVIAPNTYVLATLVILVISLLSQIPSLIHVSRLDLARATKERSM